MTDNDKSQAAESTTEEQTSPEVKANGGGDSTSVSVKEAKTPSKEEVTGGGDAKVKEKDDSLCDDSEENKEEETPKKVSLFEAPVVIEGKRDRKKTARLTEDIDKELKSQQEKKDKKCAIPEGKGTKLGDIPYVNHAISHKLQSDDLNLLHRLFFNYVGIASVRRGNIRKFCGFDFEEGTSEYEKKLDFLSRVFNKDMKKYILFPLGLKAEKTKEETAKSVLDYVMKPVDRNLKPLLSKKKKKGQKRKKTTKKSKSDKPKKKKEGDNEEVEDDSDSESDEDGDADSDNEEEPPKKKVKKSTPKKTPTKTPKKTETPKKSKKKDEKETKKKTPQKKAAEKPKKKTTPKKEAKKPEDLSSLSSDSDDSDDEPLTKKVKKATPPTDDEVKDAVKRILDSSDLEDLSIRKVFLQVASMYPDFDMSERQKFIKKTVKELIN